jgi:hypothetical protein
MAEDEQQAAAQAQAVVPKVMNANALKPYSPIQKLTSQSFMGSTQRT